MDGMSKSTRALTLIECLKRLQAAGDGSEQDSSNVVDLLCATEAQRCSTEANTQRTLTIHLVGSDYREGNSAQETISVFNEFFEYLAVADRRYERIHLALIGPNVAKKLHREKHTLSHVESRTISSETATPCAIQVDLSYYVGNFDDFYIEKDHYIRPDLAVCFNAGLWGYDEWLPTLKLLVHTIRTPLLVTSYNENEGIDDEDVLEDDVLVTRWFWRSEKNPSGATELRNTQNEDGYILKENDYWMCARPDEIST